MRMAPSTLSPGSRPCGSGAVSRTSTVTTPFKADEPARVTSPANMGFCLLSIETSCPKAASLYLIRALSCYYDPHGRVSLAQRETGILAGTPLFHDPTGSFLQPTVVA